MSLETLDMDLYMQLFSGLIQANLSKEKYNLCMKTILDRKVIKNPKFLWCIKVSVAI